MMVKKVVLGSLFVGIVGVLIYGAILRTNAKTASNSAESTGSGTGLGRGQVNAAQDTDVAYSRGQGRGQAARTPIDEAAGATQSGQAAAPQSVRVSDWQTVQGTVISVGAQAVDVALDDGRQLLLEGQAWVLAQARAFFPQVGDVLMLEIFEEDAELKAGKIDNISNGQSVMLRLEDGTPLWSASMQRGQEQTGELGQGQISGRGQGQGQGAVGNENVIGGQGQGAGQGYGGNGNAAGEQATTENAAADWLTVQGSAVIADSAELVVQTGAGEQILVEGRAWTYALDQGFAVSVGDAVMVTGFYEDGEFKAVTIENLTLGQRVSVRDANGRPMWAGGARGGA